METMTPKAAEIAELEVLVLEAAQELATALRDLADAYWVDKTADSPLFRCMPSTTKALGEVDEFLAPPIDQIKRAI